MYRKYKRGRELEIKSQQSSFLVETEKIEKTLVKRDVSINKVNSNLYYFYDK